MAPTFGQPSNQNALSNSADQIGVQQQEHTSMLGLFIYTTIMVMILQYIKTHYFSSPEHQKKFGFGDKLLGAGGDVVTSCAQEAA